MVGIEPQNRWKLYSRSVVEVARESGAELVVTLGGFLADTPHTRPVPVTGSADGELADQLGLAPSAYEGPTGIVGVVHDACKEAGIPSASLWAAVPHYISQSPNPKAALALLSRLALLLDTHFDMTKLSQEAVSFEREVSHAVSADEKISRYVRELESRADERAEDDADEEVARRCSRAATTSRPDRALPRGARGVERGHLTLESTARHRVSDWRLRGGTRVAPTVRGRPRSPPRTPPPASAPSRCRATSARPAPRPLSNASSWRRKRVNSTRSGRS